MFYHQSEKLEYSHPKQAIKKLDEDERKLTNHTDGSGQERRTWMINEFGLYSLILTSSKPEAKALKRWIIHDVLPSIRKAGKFTSQQAKNTNFLYSVDHLHDLLYRAR